MLRKILALAVSGALCAAVVGCSTQQAQPSGTTVQESAPTASAAASQDETSGEEAPTSESATIDSTGSEDAVSGSAADSTRILIAYFSYPDNADLPTNVDASSSASIQDWNGARTGNVGVLAQMISQDTGGTLSPILTVDKYPDTYDATIEVAQAEQDENARPALSSSVPDLTEYDTIFLGYPNWWGDLPMPVYTFLDQNDLSGKTIIPFVSHGGSGLSGTIAAIQEAEPDATVVEDGLAISAGNVAEAQEQVDEWISSLGLTSE